MKRADFGPLLERTLALALEWLRSLPERPVVAREGAAAILAAADRPVPDEPAAPLAVIEELARLAEPGLTAMPGGRFFGWVIGGGLPAAVAADWLTTVWDQNCGSAEGTPAAAMIEQVALRWVLELLDLPRGASTALVTGAQMANFVALAAARHQVLAQAGWDVEADGLVGAPRPLVLVGAERHDTIDKALWLLGLGRPRVVAADRQGRMLAGALEEALAAAAGPTMVCAQAGNVNGGGIDPLPQIAAAVERARARIPAWLHVDGAFGLWARAAPALRARLDGAERADSWATDAHKWLNTPYDSGIAVVAHPAAHRAALSLDAAYLPDEALRAPRDYTPELSRRARGFALWAALRELGRAGIAELVERSCRLARRFAEGLAALPGVEVMNEVVLNQVVARFGDDEHTRAVVRRVRDDGVCYPTPTVWRGVAAMRISVSNWSTDDEDVERSLAAIARAHGA